MKNISFLIIILFSSFLSGQTWNNLINTELSSGPVLFSDNIANQYGINVIYLDDLAAELNYVLLSASGEVLRQVTLDDEAYYASIVGDDDNLFAIYVKAGSVRVLRSTDLFDNWDDISPSYANDVPMFSTPEERYPESNLVTYYQPLDAAYNNGRFHIAWEEDDGDPEVYYSQYSIELPGWIFENEEITSDYIGETGGRPCIAVIPDKLIFSYNWLNGGGGAYGVVRTRFRDIENANWSSSTTAYNGTSIGEAIYSDNTYTHLFYYLFVDVGEEFPMYNIKTSNGSANWGSPTQLSSNMDTYNGTKATITTNELFHIEYVTWDIGGPLPIYLFYRTFENNTWNSAVNIRGSLQNIYSYGLSSVSNDVYVTMFNYDDQTGEVTLYYRQRDYYPLVPQNLAVEVYTEGGETYPKLTWSFNNEPDVFIKTNAYQIWRRYSLSGGSWSAWYIIGYSDGNENEYIDYTISGLYAESNTAEYKIKVRDYNNHFSDFSSSVSVNFSQFNKTNSGFVINEYELKQNHPNPFNPNTQINYSIKSAGLATIKVYDLLGTEVATLVNEIKAAGSYSVNFNATNLASGIYFYTLTSGNYSSTKKLILLR